MPNYVALKRKQAFQHSFFTFALSWEFVSALYDSTFKFIFVIYIKNWSNNYIIYTIFEKSILNIGNYKKLYFYYHKTEKFCNLVGR